MSPDGHMRRDILTTSTIITMCTGSRSHTHIQHSHDCWSPGDRCRSNVAPREHMYCQARSIARYHCRSRNKTVQETESRFRSAGYYGTEFRSRRVTTEDKVQQPPLIFLHRMQCTSAAAWWQLVISYPPGGIIFTARMLQGSYWSIYRSVTQATCDFVEQ